MARQHWTRSLALALSLLFNLQAAPAWAQNDKNKKKNQDGQDVPDRERTVIELRFGIKDGRPRTLDIVGNELGVTRDRARQIEAQALEKLRRSNGNLRGEGDF